MFFSCPKKTRPERPLPSDLFLLLLWLVSVSCHPHAHEATRPLGESPLPFHSLTASVVRPCPSVPGRAAQGRLSYGSSPLHEDQMASTPQSAPSPPSPQSRLPHQRGHYRSGVQTGLTRLISPQPLLGHLGLPASQTQSCPQSSGPGGPGGAPWTRHAFTRLRVVEASGSLAAARGHSTWFWVEGTGRRQDRARTR